MLGSDEIEGLIRDMTLRSLDDEQLRREVEDLMCATDERDRRISEVFDKMLADVDTLIQLAEQLEDESPQDGE